MAGGARARMDASLPVDAPGVDRGGRGGPPARSRPAVTFRRPGRAPDRVVLAASPQARLAALAGRPGRDRVLWAPHRASWWIAVLFMLGSSCFVVAPLPAFLSRVGGQADGATFFVGSLLFTSRGVPAVAGDDQRRPGPPTSPVAGPSAPVAWEPRRIDWWSSGVQLLGTLFFNVTTFRALSTPVGSGSYDRLVWRPDAFGSVCFLVSGYLAYAEVDGRPAPQATAHARGHGGVGQPLRLPGLRRLRRRRLRAAGHRTT